MTKIVICGDQHLGHSKSSDIFHNYFEKFYDFMFSEMKKRKIKTIIQTGDMFDYRREVHLNTLYRSGKYFFDRLNGYELYVISGNHDSLYRNSNHITSVDLILSGRKNVTVVTDAPRTVIIGEASIDLYPWINQSNHEASLEKARTSTSEFAVGHFEFVHFPLHPGNEAETGMDHTEFKNYKKVYSGHYHTQSVRDNVQYVGTPYELTWVDCNDPKGFWILDTTTGEQEFIRNPYTLFQKVEYVEGMNFNFKTVAGKYVKIVVVAKTDQKKFDSFVTHINAANPLDVKIIESSFAAAVSSAIGRQVDTVSTQAVIESVIDNLNTQLNKSTLKQKVIAKFNEATSISNSL